MEIRLNSAYKGARKTGARYRVIYGGAGSGKSHYLGQEILINMLKDKQYSYLIIRNTAKSIRHSVYAMLEQMISDYGLSQYFRVKKTDLSIECATGAKLITSGLDDVEKLKSIAGINRIWVEESSEISEKDFEQLDLRLRGTSQIGYQLTMSFNPISDTHWIKRRFFDVGMPDTYTLKTTYLDNKYLDEAYKAKLTRLEQEDYQFYRIYCLGEWGSIGNLVFSNWEKDDLSKIRPTFDNYRNGVDWGFASDPFAFVRVHYDQMRKIIYITDELMRTNLHNEQAAEEVKRVVGNDLVTCDSAEPKSIDEFRRLGLRASGARKGKGSVEYGIKWLQSHKVIIDVNCTNTISEFASYKWREDKNGNVIPVPVDANNHIIDALRYAMESDMKSNTWGW